MQRRRKAHGVPVPRHPLEKLLDLPCAAAHPCPLLAKIWPVFPCDGRDYPSIEAQDERFAVAGCQEGAELRSGQADALGVGHRVEVELLGAEEGFVDDEDDGVLGVVHQPERGRRPGMDVQQLGHRVGGGEPEPALRTDPCVEGLQGDVSVLEGGDEEQPVLLVPQQQVLGESAGQVAAQPLALLDRRVLRVGHDRRVDAYAGEVGDQPVPLSPRGSALGGHRPAPFGASVLPNAKVLVLLCVGGRGSPCGSFGLLP